VAAGELEDLQRVVRQVEVLFLKKFVQLRGEEAMFQVERGKAYLQLGKYTQHLGTRANAVDSYQQALEIFTGLVRDHPEVPEYKALKARSHRELGLMYRGTGRRDEAEQAYQQALALQKALVADDHSSSEYRYDLARTYGYLAVLYQETRPREKAKAHEKAKEAEKAYQEAVALGQSLIHDHPLDPKYQQILANSYTNLGLIYLDTKRPRKAEQVLQEALSWHRKLVKAEPERPDHRRYLAITYQNLAELYQKTDRPREAEEALKEGLECLEILVGKHPLVKDYATDLGEYQGEMGNLVRDLGKSTTSLDWYGKAIGTLEAVLEGEKNHARARYFLRSIYQRQIEVLTQLKRHDEALHAFDRLLELFPQDRFHTNWRLERAKTLAKLKRHVDAISEAKELLKSPGTNAGIRVRFAGLYSLAYAAARDDDLGQAEQYATQSLALLRQAINEGYKDPAKLKTNSDFDAVRERPDFQKLLAEWEQGRESHQP
jgi:tetratricopeptide (TPR) repeat protein